MLAGIPSARGLMNPGRDGPSARRRSWVRRSDLPFQFGETRRSCSFSLSSVSLLFPCSVPCSGRSTRCDFA